jgi:cell wall assembly regulator SMI1
MLTERLLDRLAATWRAHGVPGEEALGPGRRVTSFTSDDGRLHVELPAELRTWWGWHDGHVEDWKGRPWPIGPGLTPFTSAESRDLWQRSMSMATGAAADAPEGTLLTDPDYWWRSCWVPLLSDGSGYLVGDCALGEPDVAPIRRIEWGPDLDVVARPRTESFGQLVEWWIEALEIGLWSFDRDAQKWTSAPWDRALSDRYQGLIV